VALAGVAAGHHHAVGAPGQGLEDEGRVHAPAAHQADHAEVGLVLDAGGAGEVGGAVRAPVAEEADDLRLERVVVVVVRMVGHGYTTASQRTPSISLPTCVLSKWFPVMAPAGQAATQVPQPLHIAALMRLTASAAT